MKLKDLKKQIKKINQEITKQKPKLDLTLNKIKQKSIKVESVVELDDNSNQTIEKYF